MRLLISMLYCLTGLFGCHPDTGTTMIARSTINGVDVLFSKTVADHDVARFQCLASRSGRCHYLVYQPRCADAPAGGACPRQELDRFDLGVGQTRVLRGLGEDFRQCAAAELSGLGRGC
jgi:hypothetical protein